MDAPQWNGPYYGPWPSVGDDDPPIRRPMPVEHGTGWRKHEPRMRVQSLCQLAAECDIPVTIYHDLVAYVLRGQPLGHFLTALVTNDLKETCVRADDDSKYQIWNIVFFLYNHAPMECWGSADRYRNWVGIRGFEGLERSSVGT